MARIRKFDISKLNGKVGQIRDWLKRHHFPIKAIFIITGISSTIWFLIRVIPKPSRASYPCMQVAAPVMSGFIVYLLSLTGITIALRKAKKNISGYYNFTGNKNYDWKNFGGDTFGTYSYVRIEQPK